LGDSGTDFYVPPTTASVIKETVQHVHVGHVSISRQVYAWYSKIKI